MTYKETLTHFIQHVLKPLPIVSNGYHVVTKTTTDDIKIEKDFSKFTDIEFVSYNHTKQYTGITITGIYKGKNVDIEHTILFNQSICSELYKYFGYVDNAGVYLMRTCFVDKTLLVLGKAENIKYRLKTYRTHNPMIECLGHIKVYPTHNFEQQILNQFKHLQYWSEWFYEDESIYNYFFNHPDFQYFIG